MAIKVEPCAKRVRTFADGVAVADSSRTLMVWENPHYPAYYFPLDDVRTELLESSDRTHHSPSRGDAIQCAVVVGDRRIDDAASRYDDSPIPDIRGHVRFDWNAMDEWMEEDEPVYTHPRSPYARIDILASHRHVVVKIGDTVVAESTQPRLLFETYLPARYYLPLTDLRMELFRPSPTETHCPYKGTATYWTAVIGDTVVEDVAWMYRYPLPESQKIAGLVAFYPDKAQITVDGESV